MMQNKATTSQNQNTAVIPVETNQISYYTCKFKTAIENTAIISDEKQSQYLSIQNTAILPIDYKHNHCTCRFKSQPL